MQAAWGRIRGNNGNTWPSSALLDPSWRPPSSTQERSAGGEDVACSVVDGVDGKSSLQPRRSRVGSVPDMRSAYRQLPLSCRDPGVRAQFVMTRASTPLSSWGGCGGGFGPSDSNAPNRSTFGDRTYDGCDEASSVTAGAVWHQPTGKGSATTHAVPPQYRGRGGSLSSESSTFIFPALFAAAAERSSLATKKAGESKETRNKSRQTGVDWANHSQASCDRWTMNIADASCIPDGLQDVGNSARRPHPFSREFMGSVQPQISDSDKVLDAPSSLNLTSSELADDRFQTIIDHGSPATPSGRVLTPVQTQAAQADNLSPMEVDNATTPAMSSDEGDGEMSGVFRSKHRSRHHAINWTAAKSEYWLSPPKFWDASSEMESDSAGSCPWQNNYNELRHNRWPVHDTVHTTPPKHPTQEVDVCQSPTRHRSTFLKHHCAKEREDVVTNRERLRDVDQLNADSSVVARCSTSSPNASMRESTTTAAIEALLEHVRALRVPSAENNTEWCSACHERLTSTGARK